MKKPKDLFSLNGKVAILTGGLGLLGQQYASVLTNYGARVAVIDVVNQASSELPEFADAKNRGAVELYLADITNRSELESVSEAVLKKWGTLDILINNAALDFPPDASAEENGPFETYPETSLDKILSINLKGTFLCCQVFGGAMAKRGNGNIINIASIYGMLSPNQDIYEYKRTGNKAWYKPAPYAITKAGILNFTRYLATYWAKKGVRVNTLSPGGVFNNQDSRFLSEYEKRIPFGRMARADEMNGAIIFLASEASSYMTGANLVVDGGWTAW